MGDSTRSKIEAVAESVERGAAKSFAGRRDELRFLDGCIKQVLGGASDQIRVIQGPPGMGKSAICKEIQNRLHMRPVGKRIAVCVELTADAFSAVPVEFAKALGNAVHAAVTKKGGWLDRRRQDLHKLGETAGVLLRDWSEHKHVALINGLTENSKFDPCMDAYAAHLLHPDKLMLVLCMDEAQKMERFSNAKKEEVEEKVCSLFSRTHQACVVPLFFGLCNTAEVIQECGLSRLERKKSVRNLECLPPKDAEDMAKGCLDKAGLTWDAPEWRAKGFTEAGFAQWRRSLERQVIGASGGFPRHLAVGASSACAVLLAHWDAFSPKRTLLEEMGAAHADARADYYQEMLRTPHVKDAAHAMAGIATALRGAPGKSLPWDAAVRAVKANLAANGIEGEASPKAILDAAVQRGLVGNDDGGLQKISSPPIPSMARHLRRIFAENCAAGAKPALAVRDALGISLESCADVGWGMNDKGDER